MNRLPKQEDPIPELGGRSWAELEAVEDEAGRIHIRDQLRKRRKDGTWDAVGVLVRVPRTPELLRARREARAIMVSQKLDEKADADLFAHIEQACIAALCIRDIETRAQFADPLELVEHYDEASIVDILARINLYKDLVNPRPPKAVTDEEVFELVIALKRHGHLGPLVDIAGDAQPSYIMRMAEVAWSCQTVQSYARSLATWTPEESPPPS